MTPYEYADLKMLPSLVAQLEAAGLQVPTRQWAQVGAAVVIDCESVIISASDITPVEIAPNCGWVERTTFLVSVAYDCQFPANEDGTTNIEKMKEVSDLLDQVSAVLKDYAISEGEQSVLITPEWSITYGIEGGLGYCSLQLTIGVP
jgi:hypothetical protein